jgi:16S rRNA (cytosine1402-N4)-methyltransferase
VFSTNPELSFIARAHRGVAVWEGKVFVTTADCRLIALDASDGNPLWSKTTCDTALDYFISDSPYVGGGKVFVGNGGSESQNKNRGFISAYDASDGELAWRFFIVPSDNPAENNTAALELAASTWSVDTLATYGGGGHSREILSRLGEKGQLIAFDQDFDSKANLIDDNRLLFINENFMYLKSFLKLNNISKIDGILADFGVSSYQIDKPERGFSYRFEADLDMRMDNNSSLTASEIINKYSSEDLKKMFKNYGELNNASKITREIINNRGKNEIKTTTQLNEIIHPLIPNRISNKILSRVYQAIRIEVNNELDAIRSLLKQTVELLKIGGRISLISYHSLEDRIVKRFYKTGKFQGEIEKDIYGNYSLPYKIIGKLIVPNQTEINRNVRARSAKLRIAERV